MHYLTKMCSTHSKHIDWWRYWDIQSWRPLRTQQNNTKSPLFFILSTKKLGLLTFFFNFWFLRGEVKESCMSQAPCILIQDLSICHRC
jgi:hypothetical protein